MAPTIALTATRVLTADVAADVAADVDVGTIDVRAPHIRKGEAGELPPYTIVGASSDTGGGVVAAVEVSLDSGATWRPAFVDPSSGEWRMERVPLGMERVMARAADDTGNLSPPRAVELGGAVNQKTYNPPNEYEVHVNNAAAQVLGGDFV